MLWRAARRILGTTTTGLDSTSDVDLQAALGLSQLGKLEPLTARRRAIAQRYDAVSRSYPISSFRSRNPADRARSAHHLYTVRVDLRCTEDDTQRLHGAPSRRRRGLAGSLCSGPPPPASRQRRCQPQAFPMPTALQRMPVAALHQGLTDEEVARVIDAVERVAGEAMLNTDRARERRNSARPTGISNRVGQPTARGYRPDPGARVGSPVVACSTPRRPMDAPSARSGGLSAASNGVSRCHKDVACHGSRC